MEEFPIIIVGAGASGLIAARELLRHGKKVIVLEARDRIGGRIHTVHENSYYVEAGAEFIHGELPLTIGLLREYHIGYRKIMRRNAGTSRPLSPKAVLVCRK